MHIKRKINLVISSESLIAFSLYLFVVLYNLPIMIIIPDIIRKPLLILGVAIFSIGLLMRKIYYFFLFLGLIGFEILFYTFSWSAKLTFSSFVFPSAISIEFFICALLLLEKRLTLSKRFLYFYVIVMLITSCTTIIGLLQYPTAIRTLGQVSDETNSYLQYLYRRHNIAGWNLLFGMGFFSGTLLYMYKKKRNIFVLATMITCVVAVVFSQLMFAVLLTLMLLFLVFVNGKDSRIIVRTIPFLFLAIILWMNKELILMWLYSLFEGTQMKFLALRIQNIYNLLIMKDTTGDAGARFERYSRSLNTFINHPLGRYLSGKNNIMTEIGFHSDFCDILGTLGLPGLIVVISIVVMIVRRIKNITITYDRRFYIFTCLVFFVMFLINPVMSHPQMWMSSLLLPLVAINVMNEDNIFMIRNNSYR